MSETIASILNSKGTRIWSIDPEATIYDAIALMAERAIGALVVISEGKLAGIISERDYARKVMQRHLDWLNLLRGEKVLITDIERLQMDAANRVIERRDITFGVALPVPEAEWTWKLAPIPEISRDYHYFRRVVGYSQFG